MKASLRRLTCLVGAFAVTATLALPQEPAASAAPGNKATNTAPGTSPAIGWSQLGFSNQIELVGANQPSTIGMPVPQGVNPVRLTGQIGSSVNTNGRVDVLDDQGVLIGSIPIPADLETAPFTLSLAKTQVVNDVANLRFVIRDYDNERTDSCVQPPAVALSQLATTYSSGAFNPSTVADFLPGYLDSVTIRVGSNPTPEQQQAAVTLVARLTHLYRPLPLRIDVDTSTGPLKAAANATSRVIEIREGGKEGIAVENSGKPNSILAITGHGAALLRQVQLFADRRVMLAQTPTAQVTSATDGVTGSTDTLTFSQLGVGGQVAVLNTATLYSGFDASAFGVGPVESAKIHLMADYTPVMDSEATLLVRAGDAVLASTRLDQSGSIDTFLDVPTEAISSNVGLAFELRYFPKRQCAPLTDRMTFVLNPRSTVTVKPGTGNRGGFPALPMAFTPEFNVAVESPEQIRYAAQAIHLMAQQSTVPLRPSVLPLDDVIGNGTGVLLVGSSSELTRLGLNPPLNPAAPTRVDGSTITEVDLNGELGVVQAFSQNDRMVLAISGDEALLDRDFDYIRGLPNRWASLNGDVVATGANDGTINLTVRSGGYLAHQALPSDGWKLWMWVTLALGGVVAVAAVTTLVVRRKRPTS
ncbi:hypothetical protein BH11ACT7_BH11ACT7_04290 [soil metagenome]